MPIKQCITALAAAFAASAVSAGNDEVLTMVRSQAGAHKGDLLSLQTAMGNLSIAIDSNRRVISDAIEHVLANAEDIETLHAGTVMLEEDSAAALEILRLADEDIDTELESLIDANVFLVETLGVLVDTLGQETSERAGNNNSLIARITALKLEVMANSNRIAMLELQSSEIRDDYEELVALVEALERDADELEALLDQQGYYHVVNGELTEDDPHTDDPFFPAPYDEIPFTVGSQGEVDFIFNTPLAFICGDEDGFSYWSFQVADSEGNRLRTMTAEGNCYERAEFSLTLEPGEYSFVVSNFQFADYGKYQILWRER